MLRLIVASRLWAVSCGLCLWALVCACCGDDVARHCLVQKNVTCLALRAQTKLVMQALDLQVGEGMVGAADPSK